MKGKKQMGEVGKNEYVQSVHTQNNSVQLVFPSYSVWGYNSLDCGSHVPELCFLGNSKSHQFDINYLNINNPGVPIKYYEPVCLNKEDVYFHVWVIE